MPSKKPAAASRKKAAPKKSGAAAAAKKGSSAAAPKKSSSAAAKKSSSAVPKAAAAVAAKKPPAKSNKKAAPAPAAAAAAPARPRVRKGPALPPGYEPSDKEKYMCRMHLAYFRQVLDRMRISILANNDRLADAIKDDVQALPDENDRASKESEFTVELRERERRLLDKVNFAIQRVENRNFGYCNDCGDEIGLQRLKARPVATLCIECKSLQETIEKSGAASG